MLAGLLLTSNGIPPALDFGVLDGMTAAANSSTSALLLFSGLAAASNTRFAVSGEGLFFPVIPITFK
jgi:hypothetical protein